MSYLPIQSIILGQTTAVAQWTGTTGDTSIYSFTIKANRLAANDRLEFILMADMSGSQTTSIKLGASTIFSTATTTTVSTIRKGNINFRNSLASQVTFNVNGNSDVGGSASALSTFTEDCSVDVLVDVRSNLTLAGNTFNLRAFSMILWKATV